MPHFAAGMLMSRIFAISRFEHAWREKPKPWLSVGDLALIAVVVDLVMDPHDRAWRHILRHGALMPLYMLVLYDLALGRGFVARLFSLPGMGFLGQTLVLDLHLAELHDDHRRWCGLHHRDSTSASFWVAVIGLTVMAMISTYLIEKPIAEVRCGADCRTAGPAERMPVTTTT